jgi:hypothetical protein
MILLFTLPYGPRVTPGVVTLCHTKSVGKSRRLRVAQGASARPASPYPRFTRPAYDHPTSACPADPTLIRLTSTRATAATPDRWTSGRVADSADANPDR